MPDEIIELLENKAFRSEVLGLVKKVYRNARVINEKHEREDTEEYIKYLKEHGTVEESRWYESWCEADDGYGVEDRIKHAFGKYVFDKMQQPYSICPEEILAHFGSMFYPREVGFRKIADKDYDHLYTDFIAYFRAPILRPQKSDVFKVCIVPLNDRPNQSKFCNTSEYTLWCNNGINVQISTEPVKILNKPKWAHLYGYVSGCMSDSAFRKFSTEIDRVLRSVIRSIAEVDPTGVGDAPDMLGSSLPIIKREALDRNKILIQKCLDVYYSAAEQKNPINRRISNAVQLLVDSDAQTNDAVSLALSVVAIESLLGEKGGEIAEKLSTDVAILLEPNLDSRNDAEQFVKKLYNFRSDALHGREVENENPYCIQTRKLAAAVFVTLISQIDFLSRSGYQPKNLNELREEIRKSRYKSGTPIGTLELPAVRRLWDGSGQIK